MRVPALALALVLAVPACASTAARQAQQLYDKGDYAGAAKLADQGLAANKTDDDLWQVRIRSLLAQGEPRAIADEYEKYRTGRGRDDNALVTDMAMATLGQGLSSTSADVKIETIRFIEDLKLEPLAQDVMDQMESDDDRIAATAAVAILRGHPQAAYLLEDLQHSEDPLARAIAIEGMGRKVGKDAGADLRKAAADADPRVRAAAMTALARVMDESTTRSLSEAQGDADPEVRANAARSLAARKLGALSTYAKTALADEAVTVRIAGVALLDAAGDTAGLQALLGGTDLALSIQAASALGPTDPGVVRAIDAALASDQAAIRAGAINAMQTALGKDAALERARARLADPGVTVRLAAARLVGYLGHPDEAIPVFVAALEGGERLSAAADLAGLGDERGRTTLSAAVLAGKKPADRARAAQMHGSAHRISAGLVGALADANGSVRVIAAHELIKLSREPEKD